MSDRDIIVWATEKDHRRVPEWRRLAANWHGGQWSALYAFQSAGAVMPGLSSEVDACREHTSEVDGDFYALGDFAAWAERIEDAASEAAEGEEGNG